MSRQSLCFLLLAISFIVLGACCTERSSAQTVQPVAPPPPPMPDPPRPPAPPPPAVVVEYKPGFITSCPPGVEDSETLQCPRILLSAEQVEGIAKAKERERKYSERCPSGMREVDGMYCSSLSHTCTACEAKMMPDGHVEPCYFCSRYETGSATCKGKETPMHVCIDEYEHPNVPGQNPVIMVSWYDAHRLCKEQGKRLCTDQEWTLACEGPARKPYPYGWSRDKTACNIDNPAKRNDQTDGKLYQGGKVRAAELARLWNGLPIAASPRCVSDYGVYDMTGNVDEVTDNVSQGGHPYKDLWKGGHWVDGARNRCRPATDGHNEGFGYYANGFRCCADPQAPPAK